MELVAVTGEMHEEGALVAETQDGAGKQDGCAGCREGRGKVDAEVVSEC